MKQIIKPGDTITISKSGLFFGMQAKVLEHNTDPDTIYKPLKIQVIDSGYTLSIEYHEIQGYKIDSKPSKTDQLEKEYGLTEKESKSLQQGIKEANAGEVEPIGNLFKKRKYTPRGTNPKVVKEKRKYNKKPKTI